MKFPKKVYMIRHDLTGRIYVGSSSEPDKRYANHISRLNSGTHSVEDMQNDFNEYGAKFTFTILDEITNPDDSAKEYKWMNELKSNIRGIGYNYNDKARTLISKTDPPTDKEKMIKNINSYLQTTNDLDLIDFISLLLEKELGQTTTS